MFSKSRFRFISLKPVLQLNSENETDRHLIWLIMPLHKELDIWQAMFQGMWVFHMAGEDEHFKLKPFA